MKDYKTEIEKIKQSLKEEGSQINFKRRKLIRISAEDFRDLIVISGQNTLKRIGSVDDKGEPAKFVITDRLKPVVNQMYWYLTGRKHKLNSGIALCGYPGAGKTVLMVSFLNLMQKIGAIKGYNHINARTFHEIDNKAKFEKNPLFIEEFGKNPGEVKNYGNIETPLQNLLMKRYETRELTFVDSNLNKEMINETYKTLLADRFKDMFNFIYITRPDKSDKYSFRG